MNITSLQSHILQEEARILDIQPEGIHQRTSVVLGSPREVEHVLRHLQGADGR